MSKKILLIFLSKKNIDEGDLPCDLVDTIYMDRRRFNLSLSRGELRGYEYVVISFIPVRGRILGEIINGLDRYDVVCARVSGGGIFHRIVRGIRRLLVRLFVHMVGDDVPSIIAFNSRLINYVRIQSRKHYSLYHLLIDLCENGKVGYLEFPSTDIKSSLGREISDLWSTICLCRYSGEFYRLIKFAVVGLSGIFVNEFMLWYLTEFLGLYYYVSSIIGIEASILSNFILNDMWTFRDRRVPGKKNMMHRLLKYNVISWSTGSINWFVLVTLKEFFGVYYLIANLMGIFVAFIGNFILSSLWAWKK